MKDETKDGILAAFVVSIVIMALTYTWWETDETDEIEKDRLAKAYCEGQGMIFSHAVYRFFYCFETERSAETEKIRFTDEEIEMTTTKRGMK